LGRDWGWGSAQLFVICLAALLLMAPLPARAATNLFTITAAGAYTRAQPLLSAPRKTPVFAGEAHTALARTADKQWIQLDAGWLLAQYGAFDGDITALPVVTPSKSAAKQTRPPLPKWITPITSAAKRIYAMKAAGKAPNAFTVIGDCNSVPEAYAGRLAMGLFDAGSVPQFAPAIERFAPSFARNSVAAFAGFNSASVLDPQWANPQVCRPGESPLDCEVRHSRASIAFVALGTGDQFTWKDFEGNYRTVIERLISKNVLPVLVTKADDLESQQGGAPAGFINDVVRRLGKEYAVPVIDFWAATRSLPDYGMRWEGNENFHMSAAGSDLRILLTLHTLAAVTTP
jgi:hypothetical protein